MKNKELLLEAINNTIVELLHSENLYLEKDRKKYIYAGRTSQTRL